MYYDCQLETCSSLQQRRVRWVLPWTGYSPKIRIPSVENHPQARSRPAYPRPSSIGLFPWRNGRVHYFVMRRWRVSSVDRRVLPGGRGQVHVYSQQRTRPSQLLVLCRRANGRLVPRKFTAVWSPSAARRSETLSAGSRWHRKDSLGSAANWIHVIVYARLIIALSSAIEYSFFFLFLLFVVRVKCLCVLARLACPFL